MSSPILMRLCGLAAVALAGAAHAADFDGPYPPRGGEVEFERGPPPPPPPPPEPRFHGPRFTAGPRFEPPVDECRVFVKRRIDAYGDEVVRRVKVCDERPGFGGGPRFRRSDYDPPIPPAPIPHAGWDGPR
ncbi:hypothetical protein [Methylobacterium segetis]|uniref:hypothetical protein n=1 Tax=Methylobacterium segetis TaxID=2488750 RepID=UPI001046813E|nr:hypothetical protein [Methylobacterium segetis]